MNTVVEPSEAVGMNARRLERIGPAMQAYVDSGVYAGIDTLIARRGQVVHVGEYRLARQGGGRGHDRRYDLPPLLDDQADRLHGAHDACSRKGASG